MIILSNILLIASFFSVCSQILINPLGNTYFITANISVGQQNITVQLDTGSNPLWIPSKNCKTSDGAFCSQNIFNYNLSTIKDPFSIEYDDRTIINGIYVNDTIKFGNVMYSNFTFGLAQSENIPQFLENETIGILGLTVPCCGELSSSIISHIFYDSDIKNKLLSFYFPRDINQYGVINIGEYYDTTYIVWIPVNLTEETWNLPLMNIYGKNGIPLNILTKYPVIIDTGTDIMYIPISILKNLCKNLGLNYDSINLICYTNCSNIDNIPNFFLNFDINSTSFRIQVNVKDYFIYQIDSDTNMVGDLFNLNKNFCGLTNDAINCNIACPFGYNAQCPENYHCFTTNGTCDLPIIPTTGTCSIALVGNTQNCFVLGAAFIRQYYTIWDFTGLETFSGKIGFGLK